MEGFKAQNDFALSFILSQVISDGGIGTHFKSLFGGLYK